MELFIVHTICNVLIVLLYLVLFYFERITFWLALPNDKLKFVRYLDNTFYRDVLDSRQGYVVFRRVLCTLLFYNKEELLSRNFLPPSE